MYIHFPMCTCVWLQCVVYDIGSCFDEHSTNTHTCMCIVIQYGQNRTPYPTVFMYCNSVNLVRSYVEVLHVMRFELSPQHQCAPRLAVLFRYKKSQQSQQESN